MRLLGKYDSLGILGRGGMGQVHAARPTDDPATTVVVKVMRADVADTPRAREFFDREVKYTARLYHPYIVRILDAGVDSQSGPCIVMEFVPGVTLEQLLAREKRLSPGRAASLIACLCHALEAAHTAGVIHRDLKPANLMVVNAGTPQEHVKVMDFGLAHLTSKPYLSREQFAGANYIRTQGTPAYISPEQLRGDDVDGRADLYSAGVVLFESLAGRLPFPDRNVEAVIDAHLHRPPPAFKELAVRDVPAALEDVVRHCLTKYPAERPASPRGLVAELGRAIGVDLWTETMPIGELRAESQIPLAEDIPPEPIAEPNSLVRKAEAWMPDKIAVIKLGGFLQDTGGTLIGTQPGLLQARFGSLAKPIGFLQRVFGSPLRPRVDGIDLDIHLDKPNPNESRLVVTAVFRVTGGGAPNNLADWRNRCLLLFAEMKRHLMV